MPVSLAKPWERWGRGTPWQLSPSPLAVRTSKVQGSPLPFAAFAFPFSLDPAQTFPPKLQLPHPQLQPHPTPLSPHLVWVSPVGRPGGCWKNKVLWFLCPCPCRCQGPCASACMCEYSLAAQSTGSSLSSTVSFSL